MPASIWDIGRITSNCPPRLSYLNQTNRHTIIQRPFDLLSFLIPWANSSKKLSLNDSNSQSPPITSSIQANLEVSNSNPPQMPELSRSPTVDFILFSLFIFCFTFLLFFIFNLLFLEQLGLGLISHAVTSVTN